MIGKIKLVTFGKIRSAEYQKLAEYYKKLISKYVRVDHLELKDVGWLFLSGMFFGMAAIIFQMTKKLGTRQK